MEESPTVGRRVRLDPNIFQRAATDLPTASSRAGYGPQDSVPQTGGTLRPAPPSMPVPRALTSVALTTATPTTTSGTLSGREGTTVKLRIAMRSPKKKTRVVRKPLTPAESVSDGYFSDSDDDDKPKKQSTAPTKPRTPTDFMLDTCKQVYSRSCKKLNIIPRHHFLKQLGKRLLSMRNEGLSRKEINAVCASLVNYEYPSKSFEKLFRLDLSGNVIGERSLSYICQLLERNSYITDLTLSECDLTVSGVNDLADTVPKIHTLQKLNISGNKLRDDAGEGLSRLISEAQDLTYLNLSHNELREKGGVYIGDALAKNDGLETVDLSWNHLRGKGAECVALALLTNKTLIQLDLSWNGFGFEGCCALGHSLHNNTTLKDLDLTCNRIHPPALYELMKGLLCNRGLVTLRLGRNSIPAPMTSAVLAKFRDAVEMPLVTLDFSGIVVDKLFEVVLEEIREARPYFECLYERSLAVHKEKFEDLDKLHTGVLNIDPMRILFFIKKNLRIIDLFRQMDTDHSASVSREEVRKALLKEQLPVSSASLDTIMDYLDANNDGQIDLLTKEDSFLSMFEEELADGERRFKRETISQKQDWQDQQRLAIEHAQKEGLPADLGGAGARFSRSFRPDLTDLYGESREELGAKDKRKGKGKEEGLKLPSISDRPGNITENAGGSKTERQTINEDSEEPQNAFPNTIR